MWRVLFSDDVQEFLSKLDNHMRERIEKGLQKLKTDYPFHFLEHFEGEDFYKFRVGEYRALIDVDFENKRLLVQVIDHRSVIYKRK